MKDYIAEIGNLFTFVLAAIQTNEILQITEFILSAIVSLFLIAYRLWKWWKEAKKDGKIDEEEKRELERIIDESAKDMEEMKKK